MIIAVKIEVDDPEFYSRYARILEAGAKDKGEDSRTSRTAALEKYAAQTLFPGIAVGTGSLETHRTPDFLISENAMGDFINSLTGPLKEKDRFNQHIGSLYKGAQGTPVEIKFMRDSKMEELKIGTFTPSSLDMFTRSYDFTTGGLLDPTRQSVVRELEAAVSGTRDEKTFSKSTLSAPILKKELQAYITNFDESRRDMLKKDKSVTQLMNLLSETPHARVDSEKAINLINRINDKFSKSAVEVSPTKESLPSNLSNLFKEDRLFTHILKVPTLKNQFYLKSRLLTIMRMGEKNKVNGILLYFPPDHFTNEFFKAAYDVKSGTITVSLRTAVEKSIHEAIAEKTATLRLGQNLDEYIDSINKLMAKGGSDRVETYVPGLKTTIKYVLPTGKSIPMSTGIIPYRYKPNYFNVNRVYKRQPFLTTGNEKLSKYQEPRQRGTFLSSEFLSLLVRQKVIRKMPHGPIGGRPLSSSMLTYRTGRFANSIQLLVNYRARVVQYYYNPIYYVHETTSRDPKQLITTSIHEVMRERVSQGFQVFHTNKGV